MHDILKHAIRLTSLFGLALTVAVAAPGCAPAGADPTFEAGTSSDDVGTLTSASGTMFDIESGDQGVARVVTTSPTGEESSFSFDENGNLETVTAANGSTLTITRGDDGSATILVTDASIDVPIVGTQSIGNLTFTLPAGTLSAKTINQRALSGGTAVADACALIDANCDKLDQLVSELRPALIAAGIELLAEPEFEFLIEFVDLLGGVEAVVDSLIDQYLGQLVDYCDAWDALKASDANPCP